MYIRSLITQDPCDEFYSGKGGGVSHQAYAKAEEALAFALSYSHEGEYAPGFAHLRSGFDQIAQSHPKLRTALAEAFPSRVYVPRREEEELLQAISAHELVLVRGRVGEGKSCLIRRIIWDHLRQQPQLMAVYINLMHLVRPLDALDATSLPSETNQIPDEKRAVEFEHHFKAALLDEIVRVMRITGALQPEDERAWLAACVLCSDDQKTLENAIILEYGESPNDIATLLKYMDEPFVKARIRDMLVFRSMEALFQFCLYKQRLPVLCIDNLDRYPLHFQQQILTLSLDWAAKRATKVVLAIRERNFKRIGQHVQGAQLTASVTFDPLLEERSDPQLAELDADERETLNQTILAMVRRRLEILEQHGRDLLPQSLAKGGSGELQASARPFIEEYLARYEEVLEGVLGTGYYHLSNHCLRTLLPRLGQQALRVMFGPERDYYSVVRRAAALAPGDDPKDVERRSKRHSLFYKLMLSSTKCVPDFVERLPNALGGDPERAWPVELTLLEFLLRAEEQAPNNKGDRFSRDRTTVTVLASLVAYGFDLCEVRHAFERLSREGVGYGLTGFVERHSEFVESEWLDQEKIEHHYAVLPAGRYFVTQLINKCEYAFWAILCTSLPDELAAKVHFGQTRYEIARSSDELKLEVVASFIENCLLEKVQRYRARFAADGDDSLWAAFLNETCLGGVPYPLRLVRSVRRWIFHTDLSESKRGQFMDRYDRLERQLSGAIWPQAAGAAQ